MVIESFGFEAEGGQTKSAAHGTRVGRVKSLTANTTNAKGAVAGRAINCTITAVKTSESGSLTLSQRRRLPKLCCEIGVASRGNDGNYS
jgi:hypothetical protein